MLEELLATLRSRPKTLRELVRTLGAGAGQVESALLQLRRGGYVDRAIPEQGACHTGCGHCSVKNFCPSNEPEPQPAVAEETWRLTDKALSRVAPPA
ncbi:MAG: hypothetical protein J0I12_25075 [Candidatus Eremiobacteraeota bacterium]|nr:hypothetical protein [Candidatus Eremiobacteraeota bacterium]